MQDQREAARPLFHYAVDPSLTPLVHQKHSISSPPIAYAEQLSDGIEPATVEGNATGCWSLWIAQPKSCSEQSLSMRFNNRTHLHSDGHLQPPELHYQAFHITGIRRSPRLSASHSSNRPATRPRSPLTLPRPATGPKVNNRTDRLIQPNRPRNAD